MMGRVWFRYVGVSCFLLCALVLLNFPVIDSTLISDESRFYNSQIQQD
jgi:hypothetical protein